MSHGERNMNNYSEPRYPSRFPWLAAPSPASSLRRTTQETATNLSLLLPLCFRAGKGRCFGSIAIIRNVIRSGSGSVEPAWTLYLITRKTIAFTIAGAQNAWAISPVSYAATKT